MLYKRLCILTLLTAGIYLSATSQHRLKGTRSLENKVVVNGVSRFFNMYTPSTYRQGIASPLILVYHGGGGNPVQTEKYTQLNKTAEKHGFIVVYMAGSGRMENRGLTWNTWACCAYALDHKVDDIAYTREVVHLLRQHYNINPAMIYATGISNGGMMSYRIACEVPDVFAAVAPVAGAMFSFDCKHNGPGTSVLAINGTDDELVPHQGGNGKRQAIRKPMIPVDTLIRQWASHLSCGPVTNSKMGDHIEVTAYEGCRRQTTVKLYSVLGGGHTWRFTQLEKNQRINRRMAPPVNELIWDFFRENTKTLVTGHD
jgi:polyhydroxybutyrate depolymerase